MQPDISLRSHQIDPASLDALPRTSGVYIFKGAGALPLYIGKSVDIRSRVLAHLRAGDEAEMIAQARRLEFIETAGEIGALLLEARLVKQQSPLFNVRLRRIRKLCSIRLEEGADGLRQEVVTSKDLSLGQTDGLYGLFSSVLAAQGKLRELADQHRLCLGLLGLEKTSKRGCFGLQVKTCLGACVGLESRLAHNQRLMSAMADLKVEPWPFAGAVDLIEACGDWVQRHRIEDWRHTGTWCSRAQTFSSIEQQGFDPDTYKILVKPIMLNTVTLELA
ncbi:MAG: endonuclease [Betaproteobacteria bacterium]